MAVDGSIFSSLGVGSGLNLSSLLDNLKQADQAQLQPLQKQKASFNTQLSAYGKLQGAVDKLDTAAKALGKSSLFDASSASTNATGFSAEAGDDVTPGSYQVRVDQLARRQTLVTAPGQSQTSATDTLGNAGKLTVTTGSGSDAKSVDISLDASQTSLNGIRDAINTSDAGVNASVINDGTDTPYRLVLTASDAGKNSQIKVSADSSTGLSGLLDYDSATPGAAGNALSEASPAQNAKINVNGIDIQSQSNTVKDAIAGVTLSLNKQTDSAERVDIAPSTDKVTKSIKSFVSAYNDYQKLSTQLTKFNGTDARNGSLLGDSVARSVASRLRSSLYQSNGSGDYSSLGQIGISLEKNGTLSLDDAKLGQALSDNRGGVRDLLAGAGSTDGIADVVDQTATSLTQTGGLLPGAQDGLKTRIKNTQDTIDSRQKNIDASIARQRAEFQRLDKTVASLNQTGSYLQQQLGQSGGSSGGGSGGGGL